MHGLLLQGAGVIEHHIGLADPTIEQPTDAVVRVLLAGLCGSDLHPYEGRERVRPGVVPGHEVVGQVVATGSAVAGLEVGDRVLVPFTTSCGACPPCRNGLTARCRSGALFGYGDPDDLQRPALHGGQAELVRVPLAATTALRVPDGIDDAAALLLTDNLPTAWEAVRRAQPVKHEPLVVIGLGAVGLCAVVAALAAGAGPVTAVDPVPERRERAARLGAHVVAAPDEVAMHRGDGTGAAGAAGREGAPAVVDAAGTEPAQRLAFDLVRPGGTLSVIAVPTQERFAFTPVDAYDRNVTVRVGRASVRATLEHLLLRVSTGQIEIPVEQVLTHLGVPLADGPATYRRFAARERGLVKAAFSPSVG